MIQLVLYSDRQNAVAGKLHTFAFTVKKLTFDIFGAFYFAFKIRHRQTAFAADNGTFPFGDNRIDKLDQAFANVDNYYSTVKKFAHEDILKSFSSGEYNVLLGTQMVAKGHDIPNVTLVGILSADSTLNLPDFRASERTFALLTQAAGRAGRGDRAGHVVLQTYDPDNPVIKLAATQDYDAFAASELEIRQELGYPPYTEILKITVLDKEEVRGSSLAQRIVNFLQTLQLEHPEQELLVLGPFPAIVAKVRDLYRMNILVKCPQMELVKRALWNSEFKECRNVFFDVDPVSVV